MKYSYGVGSVIEFTYVMENEEEPDVIFKGQGKITSIDHKQIHIESMNMTIDGKYRDDIQSNQTITHEDVTGVIKF